MLRMFDLKNCNNINIGFDNALLKLFLFYYVMSGYVKTQYQVV